MHSQASFAKSSPRPSQPQQNPQKATGRHKPSAHHPSRKACKVILGSLPLSQLEQTPRLADVPQVSQSRRRRRSDRRFFEALEGCAGNAGLGPRPQYYFSIDSRSALVVTFGHLYPDKASKAAQQDVEASVMMAIREKHINLTHGYDERDLYVKQNRQHTMVPTKTQATKPVHFHSAKTAQSSDQPNTRCRGGKAQSNKHCQGKL
ncbi:hypothetical protein ABBQ32_008604 [Trebouxia sp. C0010 RCD-2024]